MKLAVLLLIVFGVLAAGAAALVVESVKSGPAARGPEPQRVAALVAKKNLAAMAIVTEEDIRPEMIPGSALPKGYLINPVQAIGRSLRVEIMKGQVITDSSLAVPGSAADCLPRIPEGMRVVTIPVSSRSISGGFLCPGCLVDVISTAAQPGPASAAGTISRTLLQRAKVWGVDDDTIVSIQAQDEKSNPRKSASSSQSLRVSLLVDTRQAESLQAATARGSITLAIRNPLDETMNEPEGLPMDQNEPPAPAPAVEPPEPLKTVEVIRGTRMTPKTFRSKLLEREEEGGLDELDIDQPVNAQQVNE